MAYSLYPRLPFGVTWDLCNSFRASYRAYAPHILSLFENLLEGDHGVFCFCSFKRETSGQETIYDGFYHLYVMFLLKFPQSRDPNGINIGLNYSDV